MENVLQRLLRMIFFMSFMKNLPSIICYSNSSFIKAVASFRPILTSLNIVQLNFVEYLIIVCRNEM